MKIKSIIPILLSLSFFIPAIAQSSTSKLELFCSSGGFLYNNLEVKQVDDRLVILGSGYDHGLNVDKQRLRIDPNTQIIGFSFELNEGNCSIDLGSDELIQCNSGQEIDITFYSRKRKSIIKTMKFIKIVLSEKNFRIHRFDGGQILGQELWQGCTDLSRF